MVNLKLKDKKVLKINHSCLIVLPKVWTVHNSVDKGSALALTMLNDGSLVIKSKEV